MIQGWIYSKNADLAIFVVSLKLGLKVRTIRWDKEKNKRPHKVQAHAGHEFFFYVERDKIHPVPHAIQDRMHAQDDS